jgi:tetratricopeptide (TPR) repeat protein
VLRANIAQDLVRKANCSTCETCKSNYAFQVAICHTIGFGCMRDADNILAWLSKSGKLQEHLDSAIQSFSSTYRVPGRVESKILNSLGIGFLISADRIDEYQISQRLKLAETSLRNEIEARTTVFGEAHRCGAKLRSELALVLKVHGHLVEAERYQQESVSILMKHFGERHPSPLIAKVVLAGILSGQGRLLQAVDLHRAVQSMLKEILGPEHPETVAALQILAGTLVELGQYKDAEELCKGIVEMRSKTLSPTHPLTIRAQIGLISTLRAQGLLNQASSIMRDVDEKLRNILAGDELTIAHVNVVRAMLWKDLGSHDQATKSIADALYAMDRLKLPEDDALRLTGLEILASVHGAKEDWIKEEAVLRQVLYAKRFLGESNERNREFNVTRCLLAHNLLSQLKLDEAVTLAEKVLETEVRSLNDDSETFVVFVKVLATVMSIRGQSKMAEEKYKQLLESCKSELGESHALTLDVLYTLGKFFANQGMYNTAQSHYENALQHLYNTSRLGKDAFKIAKFLAIAYREQDQFLQAQKTCQEGIAWAKIAVGEEHTETLDLYIVLADIYIQMGRLPEAEDLHLTKLARQCQGSYLEIWVKDSMAELRKKQGMHQEATALRTEAYRLVLLQHGKVHCDALVIGGNVLRDRLRNEKFTDEIMKDVLENLQSKRKVLGLKHPSTITTMIDLAYAYAANERLDDAENLFKEILEQGGANSLQGPHRYASLIGRIAEFHFRKSNMEKAEELERKALDLRLRSFGGSHQTVLLSMSNLASTLSRQEKYSESEGYLRHVIAGYENLVCENPVLGFRFYKSRIALAAVLYFQKIPEKLNESVQLYSSTVKAARRLGFPPELVDIWNSDLDLILQEISAREKPIQ